MEPAIRRATGADVGDIINAASAAGADVRHLFGHIHAGALVETELLTLVAHDGSRFLGFLALSDRCVGVDLDALLAKLALELDGSTITVRTLPANRNGSDRAHGPAATVAAVLHRWQL
jgi:hypothetical protein